MAAFNIWLAKLLKFLQFGSRDPAWVGATAAPVPV